MKRLKLSAGRSGRPLTRACARQPHDSSIGGCGLNPADRRPQWVESGRKRSYKSPVNAMQSIRAVSTTLAVAAGGLALSACSGDLQVTACLIADDVAFKLEDVPGWFGNQPPRPHHVSVIDLQRPSIEGGYEAVWSARVVGSASERSLIRYGENVAGWKVTRAAAPLASNRVYRVLINAGSRTGINDFVVQDSGSPMPQCSAVA
jgi:hypothetical protein